MMRPRPFAVLLPMALGFPGLASAAPSAFPGTTETLVTSPDRNVAVQRYTSVVSLLDVDLPGEVLDVDVLLDLEHPNPSRLDLHLVAPDGGTVTLSTRNGSNATDALAPVTFDDGAPMEALGEDPPVARHVRNVTWTAGTPLGTVQPEGALGALTGTKAGGPWALVILDDGYGDPGLLRSWSLRLTTLSGVPTGSAEAAFPWSVALALPDDHSALALPVEVTGLTTPVLDVNVDVAVTGIRGRDLDLFLTSPSGTRIELATDIGGDRVGLYDAVTFDDAAPETVSDTPLPEDGSPFAFTAVVPEGALGAFLGESPAGRWTLEARDDGNTLDGDDDTDFRVYLDDDGDGDREFVTFGNLMDVVQAPGPLGQALYVVARRSNSSDMRSTSSSFESSSRRRSRRMPAHSAGWTTPASPDATTRSRDRRAPRRSNHARAAPVRSRATARPSR